VPHAYIIAGPNDAGKTTFAREFLPDDAGCMTFINADLIAAGLSPFRPEAAAVAAMRLMAEMLRAYDDYWRGISERQFDNQRPVATVDRDGTAVGHALAAPVSERLTARMAPPLVRLIPPRLVNGDAVGAPRSLEDDRSSGT